MKRILSILIIITMLISLSACKKKPTEEIDAIPISGAASGGNTANSDSVASDVDSGDSMISTSDEISGEGQGSYPTTPEEFIIESSGSSSGHTEANPEVTREEVIAYFEKIHPGCTIEVDHNGTYAVTNKNVSIEQFKTEKLLQRQPDDPWSRKDVEAWLEADCIEYTIIFKGKKTGNTIQKASYAAWSLPAMPYGACTLVEMEVTEAYYGNMKEGDKVWVMDSYGVVYENGEYRIDISSGSKTCGMFADEYILHASKTFIPTTPGIENEYHLDFFALPLDHEYAPLDTWPGPGVDYTVYEKYILNKNTALSREQEMEKQLRQNKNIVFAVEDLSQYDKIYPELYDIAKDIKSANYELTERQLAMIDDALKRYGEKD